MSKRPLLALFLGAGVLLGACLSVPAAAPPTSATARLTTCIYPVADLIVPVETAWLPGKKGEPGKTLHDDLIRIIQTMVVPESWAAQGGRGQIDYYPLGMALVVRQTPEAHEWLASLLDGLRRMQDVEISTEVRLLTVASSSLPRLGIRLPDGDTLPGVLTLNDTGVRRLLEAAQAEWCTNVVQAPKLTLFNGQRAVLDIREQGTALPVPTGLRLALLATIAPNGQTVTLNLGLHLVERKTTGALTGGSYNVIAVEQTLKVNEGKTALFGGWTWEHGGEKCRLFALVTPRRIVREEASDEHTERPVYTPVLLSRSRSFELNYPRKHGQPVRSYEVWYTEAGKRWKRYPAEVKPTGKVPITVEGQGRWGFKLVPLVDGKRLDSAPELGEAPQVWVDVDLAPRASRSEELQQAVGQTLPNEP